MTQDIKINDQSAKTKNPFIAIALMQCIGVGTYTLLRQLKDALIVSNMDTYLFSWIKVLAVMPAAIFFSYIYGQLRKNSSSQSTVVKSTLYGFIGLFVFFALISFPYHHKIHMPWLLPWIKTLPLPSGILNILTIAGSMIAYWSFVLLYATAEVWGSASISIIAWGTANDYISSKKSSSVYPLISTIANVGGVIASTIMLKINITKLFSKHPELFKSRGSLLMLCVAAAVFVMVKCYEYIINNCQPNVDEDAGQDAAKALAKAEAKKKAKNMTFAESIQSIWKNAYLYHIAIMVIAYNVAIACIDITWKDQIKTAFKDDFSKIQSGATLVSNFVTIFISVLFSLIGAYIPWITKSLLTVTMMGVTSVAFFFLVLFGQKAGVSSIIQTVFKFVDPIQFAVIIGAIQNIAVKSSKYTLFDSTKEQAFAAGDDNAKYVGKAIIDVTCSRLSKSFGGFLQTLMTFLISVTPLLVIKPIINMMHWHDWDTWSVQKQISPVLAIVVTLLVFMWLVSVFKLSKMYEDNKAKLETYDADGLYLNTQSKRIMHKICNSRIFMPILSCIMLFGIYFAVLKTYGNSITYVSDSKIISSMKVESSSDSQAQSLYQEQLKGTKASMNQNNKSSDTISTVADQSQSKKIAIIFGSYRNDGNTMKAIQSIVGHTNLQEDANNKLFNLHNYKIRQFDYNNLSDDDDFTSLLNELMQYDTWVIATPVYWYNISTQHKIFLDRFTDLMYNGSEKTLDKLQGKKLFIIASYSSDSAPIGFSHVLEQICAYWKMTYMGCSLIKVGRNNDPKIILENNIKQITKAQEILHLNSV